MKAKENYEEQKEETGLCRLKDTNFALLSIRLELFSAGIVEWNESNVSFNLYLLTIGNRFLCYYWILTTNWCCAMTFDLRHCRNISWLTISIVKNPVTFWLERILSGNSLPVPHRKKCIYSKIAHTFYVAFSYWPLSLSQNTNQIEVF